MIIIIEGPSGVGKDSFGQHIMKMFPDKYKKLLSYTSRPARPGEIDGVHYRFISKSEFEDKIKSGDIFEHTTRHNTYRGMGKDLIQSDLDRGFSLLKDVDVVGLNAVRKAFPGRVVAIWVHADKEIIKQRLEKRGDHPDDIAIRLKDYDTKILDKEHFDHVICCNQPCIEKSAHAILKILETYK